MEAKLTRGVSINWNELSRRVGLVAAVLRRSGGESCRLSTNLKYKNILQYWETKYTFKTGFFGGITRGAASGTSTRFFGAVAFGSTGWVWENFSTSLSFP